MLCIVVRGATGVLVWQRVPTGPRTYRWVCARDKFVVAQPLTALQAEQSLAALASHSVGLVGAISQVVQLDV